MNFIIFSKKIAHEFEDILEELLLQKTIIVLDYDEDGYFIGRKITEENYDEIVSEYWISKNNSFSEPFIYVDCSIFENETKIEISKGKYYIQEVREIV